MTKYDLLKEIKTVSKINGVKVNLQELEIVYEAVLEVIRRHAIIDESVSLTSIGKFFIKTHNARNGVNPKTGEKIIIPEHKSIKFVPSRVFSETLLGQHDDLLKVPEDKKDAQSDPAEEKTELLKGSQDQSKEEKKETEVKHEQTGEVVEKPRRGRKPKSAV